MTKKKTPSDFDKLDEQGSKAERPDYSKPTAEDLAEPREIKTLAWDDEEKAVVPVFEPVPAAIVPAVPPPFEMTAAGAVAIALVAIDELATRCGDGWTPTLADIRELRAKVARIA